MSIAGRVTFVLTALSMGTGVHAVDPPQKSTTSVSAPATAPSRESTAFGIPGKVPVDELWRDFLERGSFEEAISAYDIVADFDDDEGGIDAGRCREADAKIQRALAVAPVSLAVWHAAYECADALGDEKLATERLEAYEALARHMLASVNRFDPAATLRVLAAADAYVFIAQSGQEALYTYYSPLESPTGMLLRVALYDPQEKRERWLAFDFLDSVVRLQRDQPETEFPAYRASFKQIYLAEDSDDPIAAASGAVLKRLQTGDRAARLAALREAAKSDDVGTQIPFIVTCLTDDKLGCATDAIDVLLPLAESRYGIALVWLATAHLQGTGVVRDEVTAMQLIDAADARLGVGRGTVLVASLLAVRNTPWPDALAMRIDRAADAGNDFADGLRLAKRFDGGVKLSAAEEARLKAMAEGGSAHAQVLYGGYLMMSRNIRGGLSWVERGAEEVSGTAAKLAALYEREGELRSIEKAHRWRERAAHQGDLASMLYMADYYQRWPPPGGDRAREKGWAQSAAVTGSVDAMLRFVLILAREPDGTPTGDASDAVNGLRAMLRAGSSKDAEVRRILAELLLVGKGATKNPAEARVLMLQNAESGDLESQRLLGLWILEKDVEGTPKEGEKWLKRAADEGHAAAMVSLAIARFWGRGLPVDVRRARRYFDRAVEAGAPLALNDRAWSYCVAPDDRFDARLVAEAGKALAATKPEAWGILDTVAACAAARGDFDTAASMQRRVLEARSKSGSPIPDDETDPIQQRLEAYERKERWKSLE